MSQAFAAYTQYTKNNGGRIIVFFLLFLLALYEFYTMGIVGYTLVCLIPVFFLILFAAFRYQMPFFWFLFITNYFIMGITRYYLIPIPITALTELPQIMLLMVILVNHNSNSSEDVRYGTPMLLGIICWTLLLIIQVFNETCQLPINMMSWFANMNFFCFPLFLCYFIITSLIRSPEKIMKFLRLWAYFSIFAAFWAFRQKTFGWDDTEAAWLAAGGARTHIIGGAIRYFSMFTDAANFGCNIGSAAVAFYIVATTTKIRRDKFLFLIAAFASTYGMFTSGTRSALFCFLVGVFLYIFLSKNIKIAISVTILGAAFVFVLAGTKIGDNNILIRRMRTAFDPNDASKGARDINKETTKKYLRDAPFGFGINLDEESIPAFHKFKVLQTTPPDSTYVFFWQRVGIVGVSVFAGMNIIILLGGCWIVFFILSNKRTKGIGAAFCCAFLGINAGGYANNIMMQYPNIILFYGGMAIVYLLPSIEGKFEEYEQKLFEEQEERKRLKLEKKKASRV